MPPFPDTHSLLYADDLSLFVMEDSLKSAVSKLQNSLTLCYSWLRDKALNLNPSKCNVMMFTRKRISNFPGLFLNNVKINLVTKCKFLGLYLDAPLLTWSHHVDYIKSTCNKKLNIMKALTSKSWGANRQILITFYTAFIKSKINYGIEIYSSACPSKLHALEVIQNAALRLVTGLPKSSSIFSLQSESKIPSLTHSIDFYLIKYFYKMQSYPNNHILHNLLTTQWNYIKTFRWLTLRHKSPFILRAERLCMKYDLQVDILSNDRVYFPFPWSGLNTFISTSFEIKGKKQDIGNEVILSVFNETIFNKYPDFCTCFTDGSKNDVAVGAAVFIENINLTFSWRIDCKHSILMAELFAIFNCLLWVVDQTFYRRVLICSDSLVALRSIGTYVVKSYRKIVTSIQRLLLKIKSKNIDVVLQWIPSHSGIFGNELADSLAKNACNYSVITDLSLELDEYLSLVRKTLRDFSLANWYRLKDGTHFSSIIPDLTRWTWLSSGNRHCDVIMAKLRSGVANLNHFLFRLNSINSPNCIYCINEVETVKHYLLDCPRHILARNKFISKLNNLGISQGHVSVPILLSGTDFSPNKWRKVMNAIYTYIKDTGRINTI